MHRTSNSSLEIVLVLHNIRSLHNVGSMFRTADAVGVSKIYCCGITPKPLDRFGVVRPEIAKTALGAETSVAWEANVRTPAAIAALLKKMKKEGYAVVAVEQAKNSVPYQNVRRVLEDKKKVAVVVGNEVSGLPLGVLKRADVVVEIPMRGTKESLNVSVAAGIVLYRLRFP